MFWEIQHNLLETASTNGSYSLPIDLYGISHSYQGNGWFSVQRTTRDNNLFVNTVLGVRSFKGVFWVIELRLLFFLVGLFYFMSCEYTAGYFGGLKKLMYCLGFKYHPWYYILNALSGVTASLHFAILRCHSNKNNQHLEKKLIPATHLIYCPCQQTQ